MLEDWIRRFRAGDRLALARLLSLVSRNQQMTEIRAALARPKRRQAATVAVTGSGGVGKSTLVGKSIELLRSRGQSVAVLACDPQSPLTGGALLGDRVRMPQRPDDAGVYIRSLTALEGNEGIADHLDLMLDLLDAFGFDRLLVETAGVGQVDTAVHKVADVVVVLLQPETGDDMQWQKAGLLEVADILVVHKADLPRAQKVEARVRELVNLPGCREVPVLAVSSLKGTGLGELWAAIDAVGRRDPTSGDAQRELLRLAQRRLGERYWSDPARFETLLERWRQHDLDDVQAADEVLRALAQ